MRLLFAFIIGAFSWSSGTSAPTEESLPPGYDWDELADYEIRDSVVLNYYREGWKSIQSHDHHRAVEQFATARSIVDAYQPLDTLWIIDINEAKGLALTNMGSLRKSLKTNYENTTLAEGLDDEEIQAFTLSIAYNSIAVIYSKMNLFELAQDYYYRALYIDSKYFGENLEFHYVNHRNLGITSLELNAFKAAAEHLEQAMNYLHNEGVYSRDREVALSYNFLQLALETDDRKSAGQYHRRATQLGKEIQLNPELFVYGFELEMKYQLMEGDTTAALDQLKAVRNNLAETSYHLPFILCRLYISAAHVLIDIGEMDLAEELIDHCLDLQLPDRDLDVDLIDDPGVVLQAKSLKTEIRLRRAALNESESERKSELLGVFRGSEEQIELLKAFITGSLIPHSRLRLARDHFSVFENGLTALHDLYQLTGKEDYAIEAFLLADQSRSMLLLEELVLGMSHSDEIQATLAEDRLLKTHFDSLSLLLINLPQDSPALAKLDIKDQLAEVRIKREELFRNSLLQQPDYHSQMIEGRRAETGTLEGLIDGGMTLLSHFFGENELFILAMSHKGIYFNKKSYSEEDLQNLRDFRDEIERFPSVMGSRTEYRRHLEKMHDLAARIFNQLIGDGFEIFTENLLVIPVDETSVFPFGALVHSYSPEGEPNYLIQQHALSHTYSLKTLEILLVGNKAPSRQTSVQAFAPHYRQEAVKVIGSDEKMMLMPLAHNLEEVNYLEEKLGAVNYSGQRASLENFIKYAPTAEVLHLSGHAFSNDRYPQYSFFAFSKDSLSGDQILPLIDIEQLAINARMVFLNGCRTGYGPIQKGEGALSLQRAFASAGVGSMVTTLWPVDDLTASRITQDFYSSLIEGSPIPSALQQSSLRLIDSKDPVYSHPYFWSSYVAYGLWDNPLNTDGLSHWFIGILIGGVLTIAAALFIKRRSKP